MIRPLNDSVVWSLTCRIYPPPPGSFFWTELGGVQNLVFAAHLVIGTKNESTLARSLAGKGREEKPQATLETVVHTTGVRSSHVFCMGVGAPLQLNCVSEIP